MTPAQIRCDGCGALVDDLRAPAHEYIGASPGCWALFGEVGARQFVNATPSMHRLTVDAYAAQHPGVPSRKSIQSVAVHLISLFVVLERGFSHEAALRALRAGADASFRFTWLDPPRTSASLTIVDVRNESASVEEWAKSVWNAWAPHQATIRHWASEIGLTE
jgi:hypothetical protein